MRIRPLQPLDYDRLLALWDAAGLSYRPQGRDQREALCREMAGPGAVFFAAEEGDTLVGAVLGTHDGRKGWINRLAVHPEYRRSGVASRLVEAVERRFEALGIHITTCLIESWNEESMAFFRAKGYLSHDDIVYFSKRGSANV